MDLAAELAGIVDALSAASVDYALCGGLAVNIYGYIRATRDVDLLMREADLERALAALRPLGFTLDSGRIPFAYGTAEQRVLYRVSKPGAPKLLTVDLMFVTPVFEQVWRDPQRANWNGRALWVVSRSGLVRMKRLAGRTQDLADIEKLGGDE